MTNILVVYYSSYGHIETMARAQAEGAARVPGTQVVVKRVPELAPRDVAAAAGFRLDQPAPIAEPAELANYDAILFGTPTRFGNMASQMRNFLDQTGPPWAANALVGKVVSVFWSTASQHGGQETTITSFHSTLLHHGMIIVGLPYSCEGITTMREVTGARPMAPAASPVPAAKRACRPLWNSTCAAFRANTWPASPAAWWQAPRTA